jgi:hypothetical protein
VTFDDDGNVTSCFSPPTDEEGRSLSYQEYRERDGVPIGSEEEAAAAEVRRVFDEVHARTERPTREDYALIRKAERLLEPFRRRALIAVAERRRAEMGVPITQAEVAAREAYWAVLDAEERIGGQELETGRRWSEARAKAFADAGVRDEEGGLW